MILRPLVLAVLAATRLAAEAWSPAAPLPHGLAGFAYGTVDAKIVVAGGTHWAGGRKLTLAGAQTYDPVADRWEEQPAWPRPFAFGPFGIHDGQLAAWGGSDGDRTRSDRADSAAGNASFFLPEPVAYAGSTVADDRLYVLGGTPDLTEVARVTDRFLALNLASGAIEGLPAFPGGPRLHVALAGAGGKLWAFGGGRWDAASGRLRDVADAWSYDPSTRAWRPLAPPPRAFRAAAVVALDGRHLLLAGGTRDAGEPGAFCLIYDTVADAYRSAPALPVAVMLAGAVRLGGEVFVFGGEDAPRHRSAALHRATVAALLGSADGR